MNMNKPFKNIYYILDYIGIFHVSFQIAMAFLLENIIAIILIIIIIIIITISVYRQRNGNLTIIILLAP